MVLIADDLKQDIIQKVYRNERLTPEEGVSLFSFDLMELARLADVRRRFFQPEEVVTFVVDNNIPYTNICNAYCKFCAFYRPPGHAEGEILPTERILEMIEKLVNLGGTQVMMQGGIHPDLPLEYYTTLLRTVKSRFPQVTVHSFSPPEIDQIQRNCGLTLEQTLSALREAGLDSLPGGGAEILVDRVRKKISPMKIMSDRWMAIMEACHRIGMKSTATMMFGHVETLEERIEHMTKIRDHQDQWNGFRAFVCWTLTPSNANMARMGHFKKPTTYDYLRTLAISRIYVDNIAHMPSGWVTEGHRVAQIALHFGADDIGGILLEENVIKSAGLHHQTTIDMLVKIIRDAGKVPAQRDTEYRIIKKF